MKSDKQKGKKTFGWKYKNESAAKFERKKKASKTTNKNICNQTRGSS